MNSNLKEDLLRTYRESHKPGFFPLLFGVPFSMGCIGFIIFAILKLINGEIVAGALLLLVGAPICGFVAYKLGWGMYASYIKTIAVIKQEKYIVVHAACTSKTISQRTRYHDSDDKELFGSLLFQSKTEKYFLEDWSAFKQIEPNMDYLLIFLSKNGKIDAIFSQDTKKIVYYN